MKLSLRAAQTGIIIAGCCGMIYTQLTMSPATVQFARSLGASGWHIGLLGALPTSTLFMQFVAAVVVNHLTFRRWTWFFVSLIQRLCCLPAAMGPLVFPEVPPITWLWILIAVTGINHSLLHFCTPLWMSWMGDYLPRQGMNRFWGARQRWMEWSASLSLFFAAMLLFQSGVGITVGFAILIAVAAGFGVLDLLVFLWVDEPPVPKLPEVKVGAMLRAPFCDRNFRSFISYACFWHFAAMLGAPFISLYLLEYVGMDLYHVMLLWTGSWVGGAVSAHHFGRLADRHGHRPVLILCTAFKSTLMVALLLLPDDPTVAFWCLLPVFMLDALLNAGISLATNGFLLKHSPGENRTMFYAAGTALAGMVGGATAIVGGVLLTLLEPFQLHYLGASWNNFHILFFASVILRLAAALVAMRVHEPQSDAAVAVVVEMIGVTPLRFLRFPVGLYRSLRALPQKQATPMPRRRRRRQKSRALAATVR